MDLVSIREILENWHISLDDMSLDTYLRIIKDLSKAIEKDNLVQEEMDI